MELMRLTDLNVQIRMPHSRRASAMTVMLAAAASVVLAGCASSRPTPLTRTSSAADMSGTVADGAPRANAQQVPIASDHVAANASSDGDAEKDSRAMPNAERAPLWTGRPTVAHTVAPVRGIEPAANELARASERQVPADEGASEMAGAADAVGPVQHAEQDERAQRVPIDVGALRLLDLMRDALDRETFDLAGDAPVICIGAMTNRSRATDREAREMRARFSALLERAADARGSQVIAFSDDPEYADARMTGRAYLLVVDGIDQWELWVTLRGDDGAPPIWRNDEPIRLLRQPRASGPQITRWPGSVPAPVRLSDGPS